MAETDFLIELGSEELPASFVGPAVEELAKKLTEGLAAARLTHGELKKFGTPRRFAVLVKNVAAAGQDITKEVSGPSVRAAFDKDGKPTQAAQKFAESQKLSVDQLKKIQTPKGEYLAATVEEKGRPAQAILAEVLNAAVHSMSFKKSMRWGDVEQSWARPLHWIIALLGSEVIPVTFADVKSGRQTKGHRFLSSGWLNVDSPATYEATLEKASVIADPVKRRAALVSTLADAAKKAGGQILEDEGLLDQVNQLVESPNPVVGTFDARHLDLPPEVLVQEMKSHQRYFSLTEPGGKLLPKFIAVSNTPVRDEQLSLRGYERVLRARLSDGRFFFDEDRLQPLAVRTERLKRVVWQGKLGTYFDKMERFRHLATWLAQKTGRAPLQKSIERAAFLAKADLVTGMVGEFPELQGVMGREYAKSDGETAEVAQAIFEHYLPRGASDSVPTADVGALLGLADRLDTLTGIFAIGKGPTGAADPFALRRACLAVIRIVLERGYRFSLKEAVTEALSYKEDTAQKSLGERAELGPKSPDVPTVVLDFFRGRLESLWKEAHRADVVQAVLAAGFDDLVVTHKRLQAMSSIVSRPDFTPLAATFKRVANIVAKQAKDVTAAPVDPSKLTDEAEKALHAQVEKVRGEVTSRIAADDYAPALDRLAGLKPAVDLFFDKVMVIAEDKALRENRVRLLMEIGGLFSRIADFAQIQSE